MKKLNVLLFSAFALFAVSIFTSCEAPKKKPRCLAVEASDIKAEKPKEIKKGKETDITT